MAQILKQSTEVTKLLGPFVDKTDGVTEETGLAGAGTEISKNGGAYGTGPTLGTHDAEGWYPITLTTTHTNTVGPLVVKCHDNATHLPVWAHYQVVEEAVYDALFAASATGLLPANVTQWNGSAVATPSVSGVPEVDITHVGGIAQDLPTATALATVDGIVDDILVDTGTTLPATLGTPTNMGSGATLADNLKDIEAQTDDIGVAGAGLTAVPWNAAWDAEVQSEVTDALTATRFPGDYPTAITYSGGKIATVTWASGKVWTYSYTGSDLTSIAES